VTCLPFPLLQQDKFLGYSVARRRPVSHRNYRRADLESVLKLNPKRRASKIGVGAALIPATEYRPILLVEDDANDVILTIRALERNHVKNRVIVFRDGVEVLDYLFESGKYAGQKTTLPAIVLLDLNLPKVGGIEILGQIRAASRTRTLPVIVLTSSADERDRVDTHNLGAIGFVRKPVDFRNFLDAVLQCGLHWLLLDDSSRAKQAL
jgi:two-component system response regulator